MDIDLSFITHDFFINKLKKCLYQLFRINRKIYGILLFGSLARGNAIYSDEKISDIDLIVIFSDDELPKDHLERINLQIDLMDLADLGIDDLWMTEAEFKNMVDIKADLILYALDEGKILFDPNSLMIEQKAKMLKDLKEKGVIKRNNYWIWPLKYLGEEIEW